MRVPNISTYAASTYQLGNLTSDLNDANEVVSTQKRINKMSDDPIGLSQVLNLRTSVKNLDQIEKNVSMGKSWLSNVETSLDSVNDLILSAKTEANRLANASAGADERKDAIQRVDDIINQIVSLGNTQINGNYIFSGTDTDVKPLDYDEDSSKVSYNGSDSAFSIKSDRHMNVKVGRVGSQTFWDDEIKINSTNDTIVFKEDNGHGSGSEKIMTAVVPDGTYNVSGLETAIRNALNTASAKDGYNLNYVVGYNSDEKKFSIKEDGSYNGYMRTEFMWKTGKDAYINNIKTSSNINPDDLDLKVVNKDALTIGTPGPAGSKPFRLKWDGEGHWLVENNPGYVMPAKISGTSTSVDLDLDESGFPDITMKLAKPVEQGDYVEFDIVPSKGDHSIGHEIGFNSDNTIYAPPVSDKKAVPITNLNISAGVNDSIDFTEVNSSGVATSLTATIPPGNYTDMDSLSKAIETSMEAASAAAAVPNNIDYAVSYDPENSRFNIRENGSNLNELDFNWKSGPNAATSAGATLGYYPLDDKITYPSNDNPVQSKITIDDTNNMLDFEEINGAGVSSGTLTAVIPKGTYTSISGPSGLSAAIENSMNQVSAASGNSITYDVSYDDTTKQFTIKDSAVPSSLQELHLLWNSGPDADKSIGETLGFDPDSDDNGGAGVTSYSSDTPPVLMKFGLNDNVIDFRETNIDGTISEDKSIKIPTGDYTDLDDVASAIQTELRKASPNSVPYIVSYDYASGKFMIKGSSENIKGFDLLWKSGEHADENAAEMLGFDKTKDDSVSFEESDDDVVSIDINSSNNKINFKEITSGDDGECECNLTASVKQKTYTSYSDLAHEVEKALEAESEKNGNKIDYSVSWDSFTKKFTIKENGTDLDELDLQWHSGADAPVDQGGTGQSIGDVLGFDGGSDDVAKANESTRPVEWGIFNTLIDFKEYLANNDTDGIERTIQRLETNYNDMTSKITDTGMKYKRLEVRDSITKEANLSLTKRKSTIEDADMIDSIMKLQSLQTSYQASLSATSKILNVSLVDYLR